jgi:hypothetical protein
VHHEDIVSTSKPKHAPGRFSLKLRPYLYVNHTRLPSPSNLHQKNLARRYPSIILTRKGKAEAMEEQTMLLVDVTVSVSSMKDICDTRAPYLEVSDEVFHRHAPSGSGRYARASSTSLGHHRPRPRHAASYRLFLLSWRMCLSPLHRNLQLLIESARRTLVVMARGKSTATHQTCQMTVFSISFLVLMTY